MSGSSCTPLAVTQKPLELSCTLGLMNGTTLAQRCQSPERAQDGEWRSQKL